MTLKFQIQALRKLLPGLLLVLIGGFSLFSCKVEKRLHRPGYHVEWVNKKPKNQNIGSEQQGTKSSDGLSTEKKTSGYISHNNSSSNESRAFLPEAYFEASASNAEQSDPVMVKSRKSALWLRQCETMVLNDGRRILIFLVEIGEEEIRYKRCDDPQGKLHSIRRKDVERIEHPDGSQIAIEYQESIDSATSESLEKVQRKKLESLGVGAFVLSLFPWVMVVFGNSTFVVIVFLIIGAMSLAISIVSLKRFEAQPNKLAGRSFAIMGLIISVLALVFLVLVLSATIGLI